MDKVMVEQEARRYHENYYLDHGKQFQLGQDGARSTSRVSIIIYINDPQTSPKLMQIFCILMTGQQSDCPQRQHNILEINRGKKRPIEYLEWPGGP